MYTHYLIIRNGQIRNASEILIFSIAMGTDYSFYVKTVETHARAFFTLNISAIGTMMTHKVNESLVKIFMFYGR